MSAATKARALALAVVASGLAACATTKGTLDRSQVETVRVDGRLYEVRVAPAEVEGEYRLLVVRGTIVVNPDPQLENRKAGRALADQRQPARQPRVLRRHTGNECRG